MKKPAIVWVSLCVALLGSACAPRAAEPPRAAAARPAEPGGERPPSRVDVPRTVVTPDEVSSIPELFRQARQRFDAGDGPGAAREFDRVFRLDPDGELAAEALYDAGISHELGGDLDTALARFEQVARRFPKHPLGREGLLRSIRLLAYMERWERAGEAADLLMRRHSDLRVFESIVVYGAKAMGLLIRGDDERAEYFVEKGRTVVEANRLDAAGKLPLDLAQLFYALGEIRRVRAERIDFDPVPEAFGAELERRAQLLLDAQSAYSDAMRAQDAHWSAMAGYRVGELYTSLHEDLMTVPPPKAATSERKRQLFEGAMRLRYSILLDKALSMMTHTLSMAERTGERSAWVDKARAAREDIQKAKRREQAALGRLPYSRAQLQSALERLKAGKGLEGPGK